VPDIMHEGVPEILLRNKAGKPLCEFLRHAACIIKEIIGICFKKNPDYAI
jgi:hypothetical protein